MSELITEPLTNGDTKQAIRVVWQALGGVRESLLPEGQPEYDEQWDEITTAMSWIQNELGVSYD